MSLKKILLLSLLMLSILLQTGCWSKIELTNLAIVTAFGIDINENKEIEVSLQIVKPKGESSGQSKGKSSGEEKQYTVISSKAETVFQAVRNLFNSIDRKIFYSNVKVIIIGERLAKEGIKQVLDIFERQTQTPPTAKVLVADGSSVKDIIDTENEFEKLPSVSLSNTEDNFSIHSTIVKHTLIELLKEIDAVGKDVVLGRVYKKGKKEIAVEGGAVFKEDKLIAFLDDETTRGYRFAKGDIQNGTHKFKSPFGGETIVSIETFKVTSKTKVEWMNGIPKFIINIRQTGSVAEINFPISLKEKGRIEGLEKEFSRSTEVSVNKMINFMRENKSDILGLGNILYKFHNKYWKKVRTDWDRDLNKVPIAVHIHSTIERVGFTNK